MFIQIQSLQDLLPKNINEKKSKSNINLSQQQQCDLDRNGKVGGCKSSHPRNEGVSEIRLFQGKIAGIYLYNCYAPSNAKMIQYGEMLGVLTSNAKTRSLKIILTFRLWIGTVETMNTRGRFSPAKCFNCRFVVCEYHDQIR